ncbi:uncharacterized protein At4g00950 [Abrus precatorius]|uniref:Uncharacterized protein At4g00950 n=1 Tax=Abrus precatorius TaxID=3816 RepID=A0A8B8JS65_ABRPR|nr:uncharacterized protein At4g00950 [Abrus precatorius]
MGGFESVFESEECNIPRLPLLNPLTMHSPERSGMQTPPLHTSVSVPFGWEEEPGKPRPCTALVTFSNPNPRCLELPPRLLIDSKIDNNKLHSPTTVLEGPCVGNNSYQSPSFRMSEDCCGSEKGQLGTMILNKGVGIKEKGWFGSWREKGFKVKREASGGSHVFPSSVDKDADHVGDIVGSHKKERMRKTKRSESFSNPYHAKPRVWTTIYKGLKQVVPWKNKKLKKYGCWWP